MASLFGEAKQIASLGTLKRGAVVAASTYGIYAASSSKRIPGGYSGPMRLGKVFAATVVAAVVADKFAPKVASDVALGGVLLLIWDGAAMLTNGKIGAVELDGNAPAPKALTTTPSTTPLLEAGRIPNNSVGDIASGSFRVV